MRRKDNADSGNGKVKMAEVEMRVSSLEEKSNKTLTGIETSVNILRQDFMSYVTKQGDLKNEFEKMNQRLTETLLPKIDSHQKTLFGSPEDLGRGGVCGAVTKIVDELEPIKNEIKSTSSKFYWFIGILIVTLVSYFFASSPQKIKVSDSREVSENLR